VNGITEQTVARHDVADDARHHWPTVQPCPCECITTPDYVEKDSIDKLGETIYRSEKC